MSGIPRFAEVAVQGPVVRTFHYSVPAAMAAAIRLGQRVSVPFGPRTLPGTVVGFPEAAEGFKLKSIAAIQDPVPLLSEHLLALTKWISEHTLCAWSEALEAAVPSGARHGRQEATQVVVRPNVPPAEAKAAVERLRTEAPRQSRLLEILMELEDPPLARDLERLARASRTSLEALAQAGLVKLTREKAAEDPLLSGEVAPEEPLVPTAEQSAALAAILELAEAPRFGVCLLHGITGSGKTEVYLQAIAKVLARGGQAIVLVPEIALTPQTVGRFRARFRDVAVLHSHLTDGQRHAQWAAIRSGAAKVVVGARSAVFAPAPRLGLIVVDEEHETSFKQQSKPRYHARDVAVERARLLGIPVVLGSATPSLESYVLAKEGDSRMLTLHERQGGGALPPVTVIDMRREIQERKRLHHLSVPLLDAAAKAVDEGGQVILLLNRRGFATAISCRRCGFAVKCPHCDITLTYHKGDGRARCHLCDHSLSPPAECPECGLGGLKYLGFGTERVEEELLKALPRLRVARMDSDTTRGRLSHQKILARFASGEADVLLGTQMIAKGLDIPRVTLVGVVSADVALNLPDFRASERTFQLLAQVAGRAGRGPRGGRVIVQTFHPAHPAIRAAATHAYALFAEAELAQRKALGYPPYGRLARVVVQAREEEAARDRASAAGEALRKAAGEDVEILGPAPCPIARIERWYRFHLLMKAPTAAALHRVLAASGKALKDGGRTLRISLDVDPTDML